MKHSTTYRKLLSILLAVCLAASLGSAAVFADDEAEPEVVSAATEEAAEESVPQEALPAPAEDTAGEEAEPAQDNEDVEPEPAESGETAAEAAEPAEPAEPAAPSEEAVEEVQAAAAEDLFVQAFDGDATDPYTVTFSADSGVSSIDIYYTQDYSAASETGVTAAIARDSDTGAADTSGNGQVNFKINLAAGYVIDGVTASGGYKNLKDPVDTGNTNTYRITKVTGAVTVTITTRSADEEAVEADPYNYTVTDAGITNSLGEAIGTSLKIRSSGIYTLKGIDLDDYAYGRIQVQAEDVTIVLEDVMLTYTNGATINCKYDTIIAVKGTNYLTRVIDNEADPTEDGGKVIKGESDTIGESVSITFTGDGTLNIDAPKKGIGVDVYYGDEINTEITSATLDATVNFGEEGAETGPTINITSPHESVEANVVNFNAGSGTFISTGDDGINVATDGDDQDEDDVDGDGNTREYMYPNLIRNLDFTQLSININGGSWIVISNDDGLDSNGSVTVNGGELQVFSSTQADNNAVDYGSENRGSFTVSGGKLLAVGMNGMQRQETPTSNFVIFLNLNVQEGDPIVITDADGNVLYTSTGRKSANCILYCDDSLVAGETYTVTVGTVSYTAVAGEGNNSRGSGEPSREPSGEMGLSRSSTSTAGKSSPKTGDTAGVGLWALVLVLCAGAAAALLPRRKSGRG